MQKTSIIIVLFCAIALVFAAPAKNEKYTTTTGVNVRDAACTSGKLLTTLTSGTTVTATGVSKDGCGYTWYQITGSFGVGYAASNYLAKGGSAPTPSGTPGKNILLIGDSHTCGTFGKTLDSKLRAAFGADKVATIGRAGMSTRSYLTGTQATKWGWIDFLPNGQRLSGMQEKMTPKLTSLLESYKPKAVIVALGANEIHNGKDSMRNQLTEMMISIRKSGASCFWVAPPQTRCDSGYCPYSAAKLSDYYALLQGVAAQQSCKVFKSDPRSLSYLDFNAIIKKKGSNGDGIHWDSLGSEGRDAATRWAGDAYSSFRASGAAVLADNEQ